MIRKRSPFTTKFHFVVLLILFSVGNVAMASSSDASNENCSFSELMVELAYCSSFANMDDEDYCYYYDTAESLKAELARKNQSSSAFLMMNSDCDVVSLLSLSGVPNFAELDELVVCSGPDTLPLLIYNNSPLELENVQITVNFDAGLSYGGFVGSHYPDATVGELNVTDPLNPTFAVSNIPGSSLVVANIGVQADCDIDIEGSTVNLDAQLAFSYVDSMDMEFQCTQEITEVGEYNSAVKVPVLNVLSVSPQELTLNQSGVARCQTIQISQDGLGAFVDEYTFRVTGIDTNLYKIESIKANGIDVTSYSLDVANEVLEINVDGQYFPGNTGSGANNDMLFDENERMTIEFCYSVDGCIGENAVLLFEAFYGCNNKVCFDVSQMEGSVSFVPQYNANVVVASANIQYGTICGSDLSYELNISSSNTDPIDGLWNDLILKYKGCILDNTEIVQLTFNGTVLSDTIWYIDGGTIIIDLTDLSDNIDGPGGLEDLDNDGFFDDLPGGQSINLISELSIGCAEDLNCMALECDFRQVEVNGKRNCSQNFQQFASFDPVNFFYGNLNSSTNAIPTTGYGIPITQVFRTTPDVWVPTDSAYTFNYEFGSENIGACADPGGLSMIVNVVANGKRITDIRYTDGSATYQGVPVAGVTWEYLETNNGTTIDTTGIEIVIPAGDSNVNIHDYEFNLDIRGDCYPADYIYLSYQVVEECNSCTGTSPCQIVRACDDASTYVVWNGSNCICDVRGFIDTIQRMNYGFADKDMTIPLTAEDVPEEDRTRFLPGDTLYYRAGFEILNAEVFYTSDYLWSIYVNPREDASEVMLDVYNSTFGGWFYEDGATGQITEIGVPDCLLNYPDSIRDYYWEPAMSLWNMGVEAKSQSWVNRNNDAYLTCLDDDNINPNYPPSSAVNYDMRDDSSSDQYTDRQRIYIRWGRPEDCANAIINGNTDADGAQDAWMNDCHEQFLQQFPLKDGDFIYFDVYAPIVHNPAFELQQLNGTNFSTASFLRPHLDLYTIDPSTCTGGSTGTSSRIAGSCDTSEPFEGHLPGPVTIEPDVYVEDCDVQVEYIFTLQNPTPHVDTVNGELPWYENEYRPYMATEYLELRFPNNMIYLDSGYIFNPNGDSIEIDPQYVDDSYGNLTCIDDGQGGICCNAEDETMLAGLRIVDNDFYRGLDILSASESDISGIIGTSTDLCDSDPLVHRYGDPFPHLPVGHGDTCNYYRVKYNLSAICPEEVQSTDFEILTQFAEPYIPNLVGRSGGTYRGSFENSAGVEYVNSYRNAFVINPYGSNCGNAGADDGCVAFYDRIFTHPEGSTSANNPMRQNDTIPTTPDDFIDNSNEFPPLYNIADNFMLLIPDLEGVNETNQYEVCAGNGPGTAVHENVVTSIFVPNAVEFVDAEDENGVSYPWTLSRTLPDGRIYAIALPDMNPGDCHIIIVSTELLFCPVGLDLETEVCLSTTSGCLDRDKAAQVLANSSNICAGTGNCFQYIAEEAEIQVEWNPNPSGEYGLCDTIDLGVVVKNVKVATLTDIITEWYFPSGLEFVPGSWTVSYPGGPNNTVAPVSIPDPTPDVNKNTVRGEYWTYTDDAIWSQYISNNGLKGILSDADSNFIQFNFRVVTVCDEFISGTSPWFIANGADPCEARVYSMLVQGEPIIIRNANPADFAQFFVFGEPLDLYCSVPDTLELTYLNISPFGETQDASVCMELDLNEIEYVAGSVYFITPDGYDAGFVETTTGSVVEICGTLPDGIGPGQAFKIGIPMQLPETTECGEGEIGVGVSSTIMDQVCDELGVECDVDVLNSVNPRLTVNFLPPVTVSDQLLTVVCDDDPANVTFNYSVDFTNQGDPFNQTVAFQLVQDLNLNGEFDEGIDPIISEEMQNLTIGTGEMVSLSGTLTSPNGQACPVFLKVDQNSACVCDETEYEYVSFEPDFSYSIGEEVVLCPGGRFGMEVCEDDFSITFIPEQGVSLERVGDSLYVSINDGYGVSSPIVMQVSSQLGGCDEENYTTEFYSLADYEVGDYEEITMCNVGCRELVVNLEGGFGEYATIEWLPDLYLDDNTSFTPTICDPADDITYTLRVTIDNGFDVCEFLGSYPVSVEQQSVDDIVVNAYDCDDVQRTFQGPNGFTNYIWYRINPDNSRTIVQSGNSSTYLATELGDYALEYYNIGDICTSISEEFSLLQCHDAALVKRPPSPSRVYRPGEEVTFTITVYNQELPTLYNIDLVDYFPSDALTLSDSDWQLQGTGVAGYIGTNLNGPLLTGDSLKVDITFTINDDFTGTQIVNVAEIAQFDNDQDSTNEYPLDKDSTPDSDNTNDAGGDPGSEADNHVDGDGTGTVGDGNSATDEDDHDPAIIRLCESENCFGVRTTRMIDN